MITRILDSRLPLIVYNPSGVYDENYFLESHKAGALPVFDTEFFSDDEAIKNIKKLASLDLIAGVRVDAGRSGILKFIRESGMMNLDAVILYFSGEFTAIYEDPGKNCKLLLEVQDFHSTEVLKNIDPNAVIVRGNEAPGRVSRFTSLVLMQWYIENTSCPVFVHGGVGFHTSPGIFAAGASGIVLDDQLYLMDEAPLSENFKKAISTFEEGDSTVVGDSMKYCFRFFSKLATKITKELKEDESSLKDKADGKETLVKKIYQNIAKMNDSTVNAAQGLFYIGMDAVFAKHFAARSKKLGKVIELLFKNIGEALVLVDDFDPMKAGSSMAKEHGTKYPIIQGPMANISDTADFAAKVFEAGAMPFFALGTLPPDLVEKILSSGREKVASFGAGLVGSSTMYKISPEHKEFLKKYNVNFALIAAGNASHVNELEAIGVKAYLHTPSTSMLENAVSGNCKRFIFEGNEAGGHIGILTSLVLWEMAVEFFLSQKGDALSTQHIVFAGGIATKTATAFISGMSSVLSSKGASVGIQTGTPYLFTKEIVETGACTKVYQKLLVENNESIVIGNSLGLATRTVHTPFSDRSNEKEHEMIREKMPLNDRKNAFEQNNVGSLLIAAKAFSPDFEKLKNEGKLEYLNFSEEDVFQKGNFHTGEALAFFNSQITVADVHSALMESKSSLWNNLNRMEVLWSGVNAINDEVAIIGMGCLYPDAPDLETYWNNIISKKYSIKAMPDSRVKHSYYYNPDRKADDKAYTIFAGQLDNFEFDNKKYGYSDEEANLISKSQKIVLEAAFQAVRDAGYFDGEKRLPKDKTAVIIGSCLTNELNSDLQLRQFYSEFQFYLDQIDEYKSLSAEEKEEFLNNLKEGMAQGRKPKYPDGAAINVESARISKHLGVEGINYTIDAACATSFAAMDNAYRELLSGDSDVVIVGGVNTNHSPEAFVGFCKMGALSDKGSFPFDERANGFILGEGVGVVVIKRLKDAVRDGDRIHAIIKGVGSSSDGKGKAIAAPSSAGQSLAIKRCYEKIKTGLVPDDIDFIEAHGTSTIMGDGAEMETLSLNYQGKRPKGVSSVKSQIGHLLGGAGNAGLIKAVLAIKHRTLPPNGLFEKLSPKLKMNNSPLYVVDNPKEWSVEKGRRRRAAASSYGFGGINYHLVIEEYDTDYKPVPRKIFSDVNYDFNNDRVVVAGMGIVMPDSFSMEQFWDNLTRGKRTLPNEPKSTFHNEYYAKEKDPTFNLPMMKLGVADFKFNSLKYKIPPSAMKSLDRAQFFALDATSQILDSTNLGEKLVNGNKIAIAIGTTNGEKNSHQIIRTRLPFIRDIILRSSLSSDKKEKIINKFEDLIKANYWKNTEDTIPGLLANIVSGRMANFFNCNGANYIIDAECAASAVALNAAVKDLKAGHSEYVIAGGVDTNISPPMLAAFNMLKVISPDAAKFFDKTSTGLCMAEGAALMLLTTYKRAKENNMKIYGEMKGFAFKSFPNENFIAPTENGISKVIDEFHGASDISRRQMKYVDAFASSNKIVDKWEIQALNRSYDHKIHFGNVKTEIGYYRSANPAVVFSKLMLMAHNRNILPNRAYNKETTLVEEGSNLVPLTETVNLSKSETLVMGANFSGLGGLVGHGVVSTMPLWTEKVKGVSVSAAETKVKPAETVVPKVAAQAVPKAAAVVNATGKKTVVLLSGQGAQYGGMMKGLFSSYPEIKQILSRGEEIFRQMRGYSILDIMFGESSAINSTENTQPAIFLSSAAIYNYLSSKGFRPDMFIGHSVGEYTGLYCSGILSFDDAMKLIIKRSEIMKKCAEATKGTIMVVFAGADETEALVKKSGIKDLYVANKNSEKQTAVSGTGDAINAFVAYLTAEKITNRKLNLTGAFHSPIFNDAAKEIGAFLSTLTFNKVDYTKVVSNVTGKRYPASEKEIRELLIKQITSPVEFVNSIKNAAAEGAGLFIELGPNRLLSNLLKDISITGQTSFASVDPKGGEVESFRKFITSIEEKGLMDSKKKPEIPAQLQKTAVTAQPSRKEDSVSYSAGSDFQEFLDNNQEAINKLLYKEYLKQKKEKEIEYFEKAGFYGGPIVISGTAVGLPGKMNRIFEENNFDKILSGMNLIEPVNESIKKKIVDRNIVRVHKDPQGNAKFLEIKSTDEVIQLAGQLGYFDLKAEYGVDFAHDPTNGLAIASGIEALKDAGIPMVLQVGTTTTGNRIDRGYALPAEMQDDTGVIYTTMFGSLETLIDDFERYLGDKYYKTVYGEFEKIYQFIMGNVREENIKRDVTDWFVKVKTLVNVDGDYTFNRNILFNLLNMGNAHFAQMIRAKGPNNQLNAACASTTHAIAVAEDWIRAGRCSRVIVISGEAATSEKVLPLLGAGFLALGATTVKKTVGEAAKPFDEDRNGMILGSAAVAFIVEREDSVKARGMKGQAEILGTLIKNSAFHGTRLDVNHVAQEMKTFVEKVEMLHGLNRDEYASSMLFMSHETYTPAKGGSADAEVSALKNAYPEDFKKITVTNTKGFTGHTLSAGIEDAVLVKALQKGMAPPIANLKKIPEHFRDLKFSRGETGDYQYGMHFAAGFGSQFAVLFLKKIRENATAGNDDYRKWLQRISGNQNPEIMYMNSMLCVKGDINFVQPQPARTLTVQPKPAVQAAKPAPVAKATAAPVNFNAEIKRIIAEQTGYTVDMLEEGLDLEADLGIDTVKQVEIFGKICEHYGIAVPEDLKLSDMNTITKLGEFISKQKGGAVSAAPAVTAAPKASGAGTKDKIKKIVAEQTGYGVDMIEDGLDLEADLGIDTVKQVEIFGKICEGFGIAVPEDVKLSEMNTVNKIAEFIVKMKGGSIEEEVQAPLHAAPTQAAVSGSVSDDIKRIIAEQTGYGVDMLEDGLDLEADLGIDTVKQVEIFGKICENFGIAVPEDVKLSEMNTVVRIAEFIVGKVGGSVSVAPAAAVSAPKSVVSVSAASSAGASFKEDIKNVIAEQTGYGVDMLEDGLDLEADLGIDTVKQVEIFGKICEKFGIAVPEDVKLSEMNNIVKIAEFVAKEKGVSLVDAPAAQTSAPAAKAAAVQVSAGAGASFIAEIKRIIAEQTGYGEDMLEEGLDLEGDLGIDTVKQVEIFGKVCENYGIAVPEDLKLSDMNTIGKLADFIAKEKGVTTAHVQAAQPAAVSAPAGSGASFVADIKNIIADQTGYGVDMLEEGLDLEGDLGIDTVKQVEIFGKVCENYGIAVPEDLKLSDMNTIGKLADFIAKEKGVASAPVQQAQKAAPAAAKAEVSHDDDPIKRFVVRPKKEALVDNKLNIFEGKTILVTKDNYGMADLVIQKIKEKKGNVITLVQEGDADYKIEFTNPEAVEAAMKKIAAENKQIDGFIHLLPLNGYFGGMTVDSDANRAAVKSLFMTVKTLYANLDRPGTVVSTMTFDSTIFPYIDASAKVYPVFGGMTGLLKSVNKELKHTLVKAVDFSFGDPLTEKVDIVDKYITELCSGDRKVEIGYRDGERFIIKIEIKNAEKDSPFVKDGDKVVVVGGGRGITYRILKEMLGSYRLEPIILGLSPIEGVNPDFLKKEADEQYIFNELAKQKPGSKPLDLKKEASWILQQKETILNLEELKAMGVKYDYYACDVTNKKIIGDVFADIFSKHGSFDGIIYAAGLEISQMIPKKDLRTYNLVFDVKIEGLMNTLNIIGDKNYRYMIAFSSVAARFGNIAQTDYSAANEMQTRMLQSEKVKHPDRTYKVYDWTGWGEIGMAMKESVKKVLESQGMELMPMKTGLRYFMEELTDTLETEVVITNIMPPFDVDNIMVIKPAGLPDPATPFLGKKLELSAGKSSFSRVLDIDNDIFLLDHQREDIPIFLGATGLETMAEAARELAGRDKWLYEIREFAIPYGIKILKGKPKEIIAEAVKKGDELECIIKSQFVKDGKVMGNPTLHYRGKYVFTDQKPAQERVEIPNLKKVSWTGDLGDHLYHPQRLFMDRLFRSITDIVCMDETTIVTVIHNKWTGSMFKYIDNPSFITNPVVVDAMFQTGGIVEFMGASNIILPYGIKKINFYRDVETNAEYFCITRKTGENKSDKTSTYNLDLVDRHGNLYVRVEEYRMIEIDRLADEFKVNKYFKIG